MSDFAVKIILSASSPIPDYDVVPWGLGVLEASSGEATTGDSYGLLVDCSPVGEYADIAQGGNYVAVDSWTITVHAVTPGRVKWWDAFRAAGASMYGARVELWDVTADVCRAVGVVTDAVLSGMEVRIECESILAARHKEIPVSGVTKYEYPGISADAVVPALYGAVPRLTPPKIRAERNYLIALQVTDAIVGRIDRSTTFVAYGSGIPTPSVSSVAVVRGVGGYDADIGWKTGEPGIYLEVFSGAGAGQIRAVTVGPEYGSSPYNWVKVYPLSPFDTVLDETSVIKCFSMGSTLQLIAGDDCTISSVRDSEEDTPIFFAQASEAFGQVADISAEFLRGEDYSANEYIEPSDIFGVTQLSDGKSASIGHTVRVLGYDSLHNEDRKTEGDIFCRGSLDLVGVAPDLIDMSPKLFFLFSAIHYGASPHNGLFVQVKGTRWDGTVDYISIAASNQIPGVDESVNAYSPSILSDGVAGAFAAYAVEIDLTRPLNQYRKILFGVATPYDNPGIYPGPPRNIAGVTWTNGSNKVQWNAGALALPTVGQWIRPRLLETITMGDYSVVDQYSEFMGGLFCEPNPSASTILGSANDWREITSVTLISGATYEIELDAAATCQTGTYGRNFVIDPDDWLITFDEMECGIAFEVGTISPDSDFVMDVSSGREDSASAPITLARDAAVDILTRDLGLSAATDIDSASFAALPADTIRAALVERERSDVILARMAREWNWIIGHDGAGKERAKTWLNRLWTTTQDWTIANADIVAESMRESSTAIEDVICQPSLAWDWTQADGFRSSAIVTDITVDTMLLTSSNYLQTISGFGDFSRSLDTFTILQAAYSSSIERGESDLEWRYGGDALSLYVDSRRMWWAACRKRILDFRIPETHAAMSSAVGDRIKVTHRRATAGSAVYGTLAGRWWHPVEGTVQLLLILDPGTLAEGLLYVDTIDPSGVVPLYTDMADGTTEQYIDQTGA